MDWTWILHGWYGKCCHDLGVAWLLDGVWIGWLDLLTHHSELHVITALSFIYTRYKSLGYFKSSQSSLVVSWQRIYNSRTVTAAHYDEVLFAQTNSFLAISSQSFCQLPTPETPNFILKLISWRAGVSKLNWFKRFSLSIL
jgi:hypothetical protein